MIINFLKKKELLKRDNFTLYFSGKNYSALLFDFIYILLKKERIDMNLRILNKENINMLFNNNLFEEEMCYSDDSLFILKVNLEEDIKLIKDYKNSIKLLVFIDKNIKHKFNDITIYDCDQNIHKDYKSSLIEFLGDEYEFYIDHLYSGVINLKIDEILEKLLYSSNFQRKDWIDYIKKIQHSSFSLFYFSDIFFAKNKDKLQESVKSYLKSSDDDFIYTLIAELLWQAYIFLDGEEKGIVVEKEDIKYLSFSFREKQNKKINKERILYFLEQIYYVLQHSKLYSRHTALIYNFLEEWSK